jgi:hypothetical protein
MLAVFAVAMVYVAKWTSVGCSTDLMPALAATTFRTADVKLINVVCVEAITPLAWTAEAFQTVGQW